MGNDDVLRRDAPFNLLCFLTLCIAGVFTIIHEKEKEAQRKQRPQVVEEGTLQNVRYAINFKRSDQAEVVQLCVLTKKNFTCKEW